jgi:hypothetical protein
MSQNDAYIEYDPLTEEFCGICQRIVPKYAPHHCHPPPLPAQATLRDQFAMAALAGIVASDWRPDQDDSSHQAETAYRYADAMLEARKAVTAAAPSPEGTARCAP